MADLIEETIAAVETRLAEIGKEIEEGQDGWLDESGAYISWEAEGDERELQGYYDGLAFTLDILYQKRGA